MDGSAETPPAGNFLTPPRILIPNLVRSRDKWKIKATTRKRQLHKEKIHSRDLQASRRSWKDRALAAEQNLQELQQRLRCAEADLAQAQSDLSRFQDDPKKT
jgi:chromosome segregation ATPase